MPSFEVHDKWAEKLGIGKSVSKEVNKIIDFKHEHDGYKKLTSYLQKDRGKALQEVNEIYEEYGREGIKCLFLHAMLDYLSDHLFLKKDVGSSMPSLGFDEEFFKVINFIKDNIREIGEDIRADPDFQKRARKTLKFMKFSIKTRGITGTIRWENGTRQNAAVTFQKVKSIIEKGGKLEIYDGGKVKEITTLEQLNDFLKNLESVGGEIYFYNNKVSYYLK